LHLGSVSVVTTGKKNDNKKYSEVLTGRATLRMVASIAQTKFKIAKQAKVPKNLHPFFCSTSMESISDFSISTLDLADSAPWLSSSPPLFRGRSGEGVLPYWEEYSVLIDGRFSSELAPTSAAYVDMMLDGSGNRI
jgi:hypothetical protein